MKSLASFLVIAILTPTLAFAQVDEGAVSRISHEVTMEVYSPFCPGKTLAMCPSPNAAEVRMDIQAMARKGMAKEDIKNTVVAKYGEEFRLHEPPASDNYGLFGAILLTLLAAGGIVVFISRRKSNDSPEPAPTSEKKLEDEDYLDELRDSYRE